MHLSVPRHHQEIQVDYKLSECGVPLSQKKLSVLKMLGRLRDQLIKRLCLQVDSRTVSSQKRCLSYRIDDQSRAPTFESA